MTDLDGTPIVASKEDIKEDIREAQLKLSRIHSIADVTDKTEGAALFEGVVFQVGARYKVAAWIIEDRYAT